MPYKCSVPFCRGNYDKENKVHIFRVPKDDTERTKWIRAVPRDFLVTSNSRVCERHFKAEDISWESSMMDEKTGKHITVELKKPSLHIGAVPSIFQGCPSYFNKVGTSRESPSSKRKKRDDENLSKALKASEELKNLQDEAESFKSLVL